MRLCALLVLLLLTACSRAPEAPPPPAASGPLTRLTQRSWQGPTVPWQAALVEVLTTTPLTPEERDRLLDAMRLYVFAREKYYFRLGRLDRLLGERFRRVPRAPGALDEDVFLDGLPPVLARLEERAPSPAPLVPYPAELVLPHGMLNTPHERPWDPRPGKDPAPAELLQILQTLDPTPEEAAALLPEIREIGVQVRDLRQAWLALTALGTAKGRAERVVARAKELPDTGATAEASFDRAMGYVFDHWDEAPERLREHLP